MSHLLLKIKKKHSGRDSQGHISVRHQGGEHKRFIRLIDWDRNQKDIKAKVTSIDYDPNRTAFIAHLVFENGLQSYILATSEMKIGDVVVNSETAPIKDGNRLSLKNIPVGMAINCLEFVPGKGAQIIKSAGSAAFIQSTEENRVIVKLPSGQLRIFNPNCQATIGQISNPDHSNVKMTKAGDSRHRGIRPSVRGVAQHPDSHPHGGGEGRSSIGMNPKTPWGWPAMGKKTRKHKKASNKLIIKGQTNVTQL